MPFEEAGVGAGPGFGRVHFCGDDIENMSVDQRPGGRNVMQKL